MRRALGSWAGNQAEVSKGAGTGQGHKQLPRSGWGQFRTRAHSGRPGPERASARPPGKPRVPSRRRSRPAAPHARHQALVMLGGVEASPAPRRPRSAGCGGPAEAGARVQRPLPRCQARAGSLPAVTFSGMRGRAAASLGPELTWGVRSGSCPGRAPHSRPRARAPGSPAPRGPTIAPRSVAAAAAILALFSAATAPVGLCGGRGY